MNKKIVILVCFVVGLGAQNAINATTIEFRTNSFVEAVYNLEIVADTEPTGLYDSLLNDLIELNGLGDIFSGLYYVTAVEHSFGSEGYRSSFTITRQDGGIVNNDGSTDISLMLLNYEFSTTDVARNDLRLTEFVFVESVPEPPLLFLLITGLAGLIFYNRKKKMGPEKNCF